MQLVESDNYSEAVAKSTTDSEKGIKLVGLEPAYARDYNPTD